MTVLEGSWADELVRRADAAAPEVDGWSVRWMSQRSESLAVRQDVPRPSSRSVDAGLMVTVVDRGGVGYAATSDPEGLPEAFTRATAWARATAGRLVYDPPAFSAARGSYRGPAERPWASVPMRDKLDLLRQSCAALKVDDQIVDWSASLASVQVGTVLVTSTGGRLEQRYEVLYPDLEAVANLGIETQSRSFGATDGAQGGLERLGVLGWSDAAPRVGEEAVQLLYAPDCPTGTMDLVLAPDQMILQIHESIGHPLELDRILGDERNFAGTSFVTLDMFGSYQYGSEHLNITFDPTGHAGQIAGYGFDDEGTPADRQFLIRDGLLERPLGGHTSQLRAGVEGVANARACSWNRPPIDRMANINLEPGTSTFSDLIGGIEWGVYMETNSSWSIDDSRNKFQFGCERGRLIVDGQLGDVVKHPNYRGISAEFWRALDGVGDPSTLVVMGVPNCGKGEPNQVIRVGHASPPCRFRNVEVFA